MSDAANPTNLPPAPPPPPPSKTTLQKMRSSEVAKYAIPVAVGATVAIIFGIPVLFGAIGGAAGGWLMNRKPKGRWADATAMFYTDGQNRVWTRDPASTQTTIVFSTPGADGKKISVSAVAGTTTDAFGLLMDVAA